MQAWNAIYQLARNEVSPISIHAGLEHYLSARIGTIRFPCSITNKMSPQRDFYVKMRPSLLYQTKIKW